MIYIVWSNWDGTVVESFESIEIAERRFAELKALEGVNEYGTRIHITINGKKMSTEVVEVTSKIRLIDM